MSSTDAQLDSAAKKLGVDLISHFLNAGLLGVLIVQTYNYYLAFPEERWYRKLLVYAMLALQTTQTFLSGYDAARFITMAIKILQTSPWSCPSVWFSLPILGAIVALSTHLFFAYYIRLILITLVPGIIIIVLSLISNIVQVIAGIITAKADSFATISEDVKVLEPISAFVAAACNIIYLSLMVYHLISNRENGLSTTPSVARKIFRLIIETGLILALISILNCISMFNSPISMYHTIFAESMNKFYFITVLIILNGRPEEETGITCSQQTETQRTLDGLEKGQNRLWISREQGVFQPENELYGVKIKKEVYIDREGTIARESGSGLERLTEEESNVSMGSAY